MRFDISSNDYFTVSMLTLGKIVKLERIQICLPNLFRKQTKIIRDRLSLRVHKTADCDRLVGTRCRHFAAETVWYSVVQRRGDSEME